MTESEQPPQQPQQQPEPTTADSSGPTDDPLRGSRTAATYTALAALVVLLILLTVFIIQNTQAAEVSFFGWEGTAPIAALLLIAATSGMLLVLIAGTLRIWQLRRRVRRTKK